MSKRDDEDFVRFTGLDMDRKIAAMADVIDETIGSGYGFALLVMEMGKPGPTVHFVSSVRRDQIIDVLIDTAATVTGREPNYVTRAQRPS